jgi:hypothetical protein
MPIFVVSRIWKVSSRRLAFTGSRRVFFCGFKRFVEAGSRLGRARGFRSCAAPVGIASAAQTKAPAAHARRQMGEVGALGCDHGSMHLMGSRISENTGVNRIRAEGPHTQLREFDFQDPQNGARRRRLRAGLSTCRPACRTPRACCSRPEMSACHGCDLHVRGIAPGRVPPSGVGAVGK